MKLVLIFVGCCVLFVAQAQFPEELNAFKETVMKGENFPRQYKQQITQSRRRFLKKMYNDTSSSLCSGKQSFGTFSAFAGHYDTTLFLHDFDFDGDYDVLFWGKICPEDETPELRIFYKSGKSYEEQLLGNWLISMERTPGSCTIVSLKTPCCNSNHYQAMEFKSTRKERSGFEQLTNQAFAYDYSDVLPEAMDTVFNFPIEKEIWANAGAIEAYAETDKTAMIGTIKPNVPIHAYNRLTILGKEWYYIVVNPEVHCTVAPGWNDETYGKITVLRGWIVLE